MAAPSLHILPTFKAMNIRKKKGINIPSVHVLKNNCLLTFQSRRSFLI